ncbi:hypothetical protein E0Z10_g4572 [Xylaria hypoxylon]|uniref:Heterokaryon incompatibility domain-containing protein n=1 Tax=Xylaria hypoxylon TaxID=37992 RepID=A0A4Z0YW94_9PEZI|nr:hypothetical protein E0Z10_g4572 [Xylaria hypoxylon]
MICDCCMRIFNLNDHFGGPTPHHVNTQSFVSAVTTGCPICRAILSELDEPQKVLSDLSMISSTECFIVDLKGVGSRVQSYYLNFTWKLQGIDQNDRGLLVQQYHTIRPYLPRSPLKAHRGWTGQTLQMVKTWMRNCLEHHPKCQTLHTWKTSGSMFQPKRLVDVGPADGTTWRLILREDNAIFHAPYATLSHRWGTLQQLNLVSDNLQAYTNDQPLDMLPQVFQDAIKVIQSLGIRYLWADCLCIMQDSLPDWEIESLQMRKIYTNSICTISITGFEDNPTGFLNKTCDYVPLPYPVQPRWARNIQGGWCVLDPFFWWWQVTKAPLTKRGWVFQERFLSPRVIHFGPEQLLWECASLDACEAFPQGLPAVVESPRHTGFKRLDFLFKDNAREGLLPENRHLLSVTEEDLLHHWCGIVQAYTRTNLTKPSDKLIALAGVAQLMSPPDDPTNTMSSNRYLAGLFEQHLLLMLEWHSDGNMYSLPEPSRARPLQYRAPSWSWASVDRRVFYDYLPRGIDEHQLWARKRSWEMSIERLNRHMNPGDTSHWPLPRKCLSWKSLVFSLQASVTTAGESPFGQILDDAPTNPGQIELNTLLLPLRCIQLLSSDNNNPFYWVTGLLLEPVDTDESTYQRCGMMSILSTDGVREIGIELNGNPFMAQYSAGIKLEAIQII